MAITPRIVTGRMVNRAMTSASAFKPPTASSATEIVATDIATCAKVNWHDALRKWGNSGTFRHFLKVSDNYGIFASDLFPLARNDQRLQSECSRCTRSLMLGVNARMGLKLFGREIIFEEFQTKRHGRTDGRTDRQMDGRHAISWPRSVLASRGKNG